MQHQATGDTSLHPIGSDSPPAEAPIYLLVAWRGRSTGVTVKVDGTTRQLCLELQANGFELWLLPRVDPRMVN